MTTSGNRRSQVPRILARIAAGLVVLLMALLIGGFVLGVEMLRSFKPSSTEPDPLRSDLLECLDVSRTTDIEVNVPAWLTALCRVGASVAHLDPRVRAAAGTVRTAFIGAYELVEMPERENAFAMLETADARLLERGDWTRIVTVVDEEQIAAVYVMESTLNEDTKAELFLIVLDHRDLVIASGRIDTESVLKLASSAMNQLDLGDPPWCIVQ